jgi:hypothetical protein
MGIFEDGGFFYDFRRPYTINPKRSMGVSTKKILTIAFFIEAVSY